MNKKQIFSKSLQASKDLVNGLTKEQLEEIMNVFDNYETEQCAINDVVLQSEQLPDGYCKWCKQTPCERLNWSHPLEDDDE